MKQLIIKKGVALNEEVAIPKISSGHVLIRVAYSCISAGTEMAGVERTKKSMLARAMEKPEKVKMALDLLKQRGLINTLKQIKDINDTGSPSGYSISGTVIETGDDIADIKSGDKVAAAGGGFAIHAEYVLVPKNLVVKIPDGVEIEDASAATIGSIALHGVRRAQMIIGEYGVVVGCGIIGLMTIQILKASGIKVAAIDPDQRRLQLAKKLGAEVIINPKDEISPEMIKNWSNGMGADAVIFTAAVNDPAPLNNAFKLCRRKGKVVLVGSAPIEIDRQNIYADEIDFLISTSYGPGRYDKNYEEEGNDYPYAYVRWTEQRNIAEFLRLISEKLVDISVLTDKIFPIDKSNEAFTALSDADTKPLIVLLKYHQETGTNNISSSHKIINPVIKTKKKSGDSIIRIGLIGTGDFLKSVHLPNLQLLKEKFVIHGVMSHKGYDAKAIADQNQASYSTTEYQQIINDPEIDLVFISTRHESHSSLVLQALQTGKNVFVEKPLAISQEQLNPIIDFYNNNPNPPMLMVGFNRRFSPLSVEIKKHTEKRINPLFIRYRMNAGYLKKDHWVFKEGGRIIGEACHIIDLMTYVTNSTIQEISSTSLSPKTENFSPDDNKTFSLKFNDGSVASIDYFSCGSNKLPKEFMEIHFDHKSILMDDFKTLRSYGINVKEFNLKLSDKGHLNELLELRRSLTGETAVTPIDWRLLIQTTNATIRINQCL
ncbi:Inositol 2-dehydrogenase/D-chiro-inositol 3-dehydrogenase [subsurface metagenome]